MLSTGIDRRRPRHRQKRKKTKEVNDTLYYTVGTATLPTEFKYPYEATQDTSLIATLRSASFASDFSSSRSERSPIPILDVSKPCSARYFRNAASSSV
jgi:phosphoenolpyruvate carboxylase